MSRGKKHKERFIPVYQTIVLSRSGFLTLPTGISNCKVGYTPSDFISRSARSWSPAKIAVIWHDFQRRSRRSANNAIATAGTLRLFRRSPWSVTIAKCMCRRQVTYQSHARRSPMDTTWKFQATSCRWENNWSGCSVLRYIRSHSVTTVRNFQSCRKSTLLSESKITDYEYCTLNIFS